MERLQRRKLYISCILSTKCRPAKVTIIDELNQQQVTKYMPYDTGVYDFAERYLTSKGIVIQGYNANTHEMYSDDLTTPIK